METKDFKKIFGGIAKANGFTSEFGGWFKDSAETIVVLDLQKSNFGNYFELNLKVYLQGIFGTIYTKNKNLVSNLIGDIFVRHPREYDDAMNLDTRISISEREDKIRILFSEFIVPLAENALSRSGIRNLIKQKRISVLPAVMEELNCH